MHIFKKVFFYILTGSSPSLNALWTQTPARGETVALRCAARGSVTEWREVFLCWSHVVSVVLAAHVLSWPNAQLPQWCYWRWDGLLVVRDHLLHQTSGLWRYSLCIGNLLSFEEGFAYKNHPGPVDNWAHGDRQENHSALCVSKPPWAWLLLTV